MHHPCSTRRSAALLRLAAMAALLASAPACGRTPDAKQASAGDSTPPDGSGPPLVALIRAADWMGSEWGEDAIALGLRESDMEPGRDYQLRISSAQGDLATLPTLIDAALDARASVIVTLQDATLQAAVERAKSVPIVFNLLSDPFAAGAGTSDTSHLPNITGVYSPGFGDPEQTRRVELIRRVVPGAKTLGILFSPEEQLAVDFKERMTEAARRAGLDVAEAPVSQVSEVANAAQALCARKVHAIELYGNVAHAGFGSLIKAARDCKVPVFSPAPFEVMQGAVASFFPDFQEGGVEAGKMVARVLRGESPAGMPFVRLETTKLIVNPAEAKAAGVTLPADVVREADSVVGPR